MSIDLTPIFQAIIALLAALITYKLIPWIKARTTNEQQQTIEATIRTLVFAAEQVYGAGNGKQKLWYVTEKLEERGFDVDLTAIEAAVKEYLNYDRAETIGDDADTDGATEEELRETLKGMYVPIDEINACTSVEDLKELLAQEEAGEAEPPTAGGTEE